MGHLQNSDPGFQAMDDMGGHFLLDGTINGLFQTTQEVKSDKRLKSNKKKCEIFGCTKNSLPMAKSYHQLPERDETIWQKWLEVVQRSRNDAGWLPTTDHPIICGRHFAESDFILNGDKDRKRLLSTAVPTLYVDHDLSVEQDPRFSLPREQRLPSLAAFLKMKFQMTCLKIEKQSSSRVDGGLGGNRKKRKRGVEMKECVVEVVDSKPIPEIEEIHISGKRHESSSSSSTDVIDLWSSSSSADTQNSSEPYSQIESTLYIIPQDFVEIWYLPENPLNDEGIAKMASAASSSSDQDIEVGVEFITSEEDNQTQDNQNQEDGQGSNPTTAFSIQESMYNAIVESLEREMEKLAKNFNIPYHVVEGVWNSKDCQKY